MIIVSWFSNIQCQNTPHDALKEEFSGNHLFLFLVDWSRLFGIDFIRLMYDSLKKLNVNTIIEKIQTYFEQIRVVWERASRTWAMNWMRDKCNILAANNKKNSISSIDRNQWPLIE